MDPRTYQRALQGDHEAFLVMEGELKAVARALLAHPTLAVGDPVTQRVLTNAAVAEVLERGLSDLDSVIAATVMAAARRAVEHQRRAETSGAGAGHLPPGILVSAALVPQVLATASREAAERHLSTCSACTDMARRVREAAAEVVASVEGPAGEVVQSPASAAEDPDPEESSAFDVESMMRRLAGQEGARDMASGPRPVRKRGRNLDPRRLSRQGSDPSLRAAPLVFLGLALVALLAFASRGWWNRPAAPRIESDVVGLASRDLPKLPEPRNLPAPLEPGLRDLAGGDCHLATYRFRLARQRDPALAEAWYWEGLSAVCDGAGAAGLAALRGAAERSSDLADLDWYLAQAALLEGQVDPAAEHLVSSCKGGGARAPDACGQYARLMGR
jgi:hypothetical protein